MERRDGRGRPGAPNSQQEGTPPKERAKPQQKRAEGRVSVYFNEKKVFDRISLHVDRMLEKGLVTEKGAVWLKEYAKQDRKAEDESKPGKAVFDCIHLPPIPNQAHADLMFRRGVITEEEVLELEQLRSREAEGHFTDEEKLWLKHIRATYFHTIPPR